MPLPRNRLDSGLADGDPGLICYLPLGDPLAPGDAADRYVAAGVDVIEIGIPVPHPYLDGSSVRDSMARALAAGMTVDRAAQETARLRERYPSQAMVWVTYGPAVDEDSLVTLAARAGVDGVLFPEPARYFSGLARRLRDVDVHHLHFLHRDASDAEVEQARASGGYVMLQAIHGQTGTGRPDEPLPDSRAQIARLRAAGVTAPIALGVGISTAAHVRQAVAMGADAVIVGTAVLNAALAGPETLDALLRDLRAVEDP